jgi:hypothetical protein
MTTVQVPPKTTFARLLLAVLTRQRADSPRDCPLSDVIRRHSLDINTEERADGILSLLTGETLQSC